MNLKQQRYIFKAFLASDIPAAIRENAPELLALDSALSGYCTERLRHKNAAVPVCEIITKEDKRIFSELIDHTAGAARDALIVYYRLAILVEYLLLHCS